MESHSIHNQKNVSVLMHPSVCAAKYRGVLMNPQVDEVRKEVCMETARQWGIWFFGDWGGWGSFLVSKLKRCDQSCETR